MKNAYKLIAIWIMCIFLAGCIYLEEKPTTKPPEQIPEPAKEPIKEELKVLHWGHMPITYYISNEEECGDYEARKIIRGFNEVENATKGAVFFEKIDQPADINIKCSFIEDCYRYWVDVQETKIYRYESICNHIKGTAWITRARGYEILNAEIELIGLAGFAETNYGRGSSGFYIGSCGHATTEVHEILHTFGFGHKNDTKSIMYYAEDSVLYTLQEPGACIGKRKTIDQNIVNGLIQIYG
jgi:hypothetical protein